MTDLLAHALAVLVGVLIFGAMLYTAARTYYLVTAWVHHRARARDWADRDDAAS